MKKLMKTHSFSYKSIKGCFLYRTGLPMFDSKFNLKVFFWKKCIGLYGEGCNVFIFFLEAICQILIYIKLNIQNQRHTPEKQRNIN